MQSSRKYWLCTFFIVFFLLVAVVEKHSRKLLTGMGASTDGNPVLAFNSETLQTISGFRLLGPRRKNLREGNAFAISMAEEALPVEQLPKMVPGHPRLLVRKAPWKYGLSLDELRIRAQMQPWAGQIAIAMRKPPDHSSYRPTITRRALLYLLTGDERLVPRLVQHVLDAKHAFNVGGGLV